MRLLLVLLLSAGAACAESSARYLANAGVLVTHGDTKIVFDPLFRESYGQYELLPDDMRQALFAGRPPFENLDAVLVSHYHNDHFSPEATLQLLQAHAGLTLYAPAQAVSAMAAVAEPGDDRIFERVVAIELQYRQAPVLIEAGQLVVEAVRIPHSGWPDSRSEVQNIAFRVTLDDEATVVHLGDADTSDSHFSQDPDFWSRRHTDIAFPPYWFFLSGSGRKVLLNRLRPGRAVGVHVPERVLDDPAARAGEMQGYDLFTEPGETRPLKPAEGGGG